MEDALYLAVSGNADINTTDGMCTAAMMLHAVLLWTYTSLYSAVGVCTAFHTSARVHAALFTAVVVGVILPFYCSWCGRYAAFSLLLVYVLPFTLLLG